MFVFLFPYYWLVEVLHFILCVCVCAAHAQTYAHLLVLLHAYGVRRQLPGIAMLSTWAARTFTWSTITLASKSIDII